jgi:hypothetical protein
MGAGAHPLSAGVSEPPLRRLNTNLASEEGDGNMTRANRIIHAQPTPIGVRALAIILAAGLSMWGCGDDGSPTPAAGPAATGPLYVVSHSVFTEKATTSYLTVVDSLAPGPSVNLAASLEFGGGARAYGPEGKSVVYVTSSENGTMTEVAFGPDGAPQVGRVVSFANLGISNTTGGNVHHFVSPTKAYFVSQAALQIVIWNPEAMEIIGTIALDVEAARMSPGTTFYFYPRPIVVGDRLVLIANQADDNEFDGPPVVSVVDMTTDRLASSTLETRCHALLQSAVDSQGHRYFASSQLAAAAHFLFPDRAPAPCMVRMRGGETALDPGWSRNVTQELGTRLWTGITPGAGGKLYLQSIAENAAEVVGAAAMLDHYKVSSAKPWSWHAQGAGDASPTPAEGAGFLSAPPLFAAIPVDGRAYVSVWDQTDTTLVDVTSHEAPQRGLEVPGFAYNVVRIR